MTNVWESMHLVVNGEAWNVRNNIDSSVSLNKVGISWASEFFIKNSS